MMSIHTNGSLNGSDLEIIKRLDDAGLSHAQVYPIDHTVYESDYESILPLLDSYKGKGVSYRVVEYGFHRVIIFMDIT